MIKENIIINKEERLSHNHQDRELTPGPYLMFSSGSGVWMTQPGASALVPVYAITIQSTRLC